MTLSAYLGVAGLGDVGYRFYNANETPSGSRITAGIVNAGDGWYSAEATIPEGIASVRWNSTGNPEVLAREYFAPSSAVDIDATQIADEILKRDWQAVTGEAEFSLLNALRAVRNAWNLSPDGLLTVFKEDGTTVSWQRTARVDAAAQPIVGVD